MRSVFPAWKTRKPAQPTCPAIETSGTQERECTGAWEIIFIPLSSKTTIKLAEKTGISVAAQFTIQKENRATVHKCTDSKAARTLQSMTVKSKLTVKFWRDSLDPWTQWIPGAMK